MSKMSELHATMTASEQSTAAKEAIRIADKHLPQGSVEQRKALALEIVAAISICESEMWDDVLGVIKAATVQQ